MQIINIPYLNPLSQPSELLSLKQYAFDDTIIADYTNVSHQVALL